MTHSSDSSIAKKQQLEINVSTCIEVGVMAISCMLDRALITGMLTIMKL